MRRALADKRVQLLVWNSRPGLHTLSRALRRQHLWRYFNFLGMEVFIHFFDLGIPFIAAYWIFVAISHHLLSKVRLRERIHVCAHKVPLARFDTVESHIL